MGSFPDDRTALVTGAASPRGIGRATVHQLARAGWNIAMIDLDGDGCIALAKEVSHSYGVRAVGVGVDVTDDSGVHSAIDRFEGELPQVVGLANIAGVSSPTGYFDLSVAEWNRVTDVNVNGVHNVTRRVAEIMVRNRVGRIVTMSSVSAQRGGGTFSRTPYSVSKAALIGLTRSLARELGKFDVTVNAIAPGPIDTDIMGGPLTTERKATLVADLLVTRVGTTDDIASATRFLLSEEAGYITGQTLNVDGGLYMH